MKTIGVLGGMSWESTAQYYRLANELAHDPLGGYHSARIVVDSVDFAEIERIQAEGRWEDAGRMLAARAAALEAAGAELIVLATNTMHKVAGAIAAAITVPFLHIADATAAAVRDAGLTRLGLLGTAFTMSDTFLSGRLEERGLVVLVPDQSDAALVHRVIYDELVHGVIREESRAAYRGVIERLAARGAEGIVLGCTEIELLVRAEDSRVPVFPTTRLHIEAAVDAAFA